MTGQYLCVYMEVSPVEGKGRWDRYRVCEVGTAVNNRTSIVLGEVRVVWRQGDGAGTGQWDQIGRRD